MNNVQHEARNKQSGVSFCVGLDKGTDQYDKMINKMHNSTSTGNVGAKSYETATCLMTFFI